MDARVAERIEQLGLVHGGQGLERLRGAVLAQQPEGDRPLGGLEAGQLVGDGQHVAHRQPAVDATQIARLDEGLEVEMVGEDVSAELLPACVGHRHSSRRSPTRPTPSGVRRGG